MFLPNEDVLGKARVYSIDVKWYISPKYDHTSTFVALITFIEPATLTTIVMKWHARLRVLPQSN